MPVAAVLGIAAIRLARRARRRLERTLGRAGGERAARARAVPRLARALPRADRVASAPRRLLRSSITSCRRLQAPRVRDRQQPPRGSSAAGARLLRRSSRRRRFAASTCAPSKRSNSTSLPAQTYVKGFLRSYADYLGLDGQLYVDEFNSRYVRGELEEEEEQRRSAPRGRRRAGRSGGLPSESRDADRRGHRRPDRLRLRRREVAVAATRTRATRSRTRRRRRHARTSLRLISSSRRSGAARTSPSHRGRAYGQADLPGHARGRRQPARSSGSASGSTSSLPANLRLRLNERPCVVPGQGTGAHRLLEVTPTRVSLAPPVG